MWNGMRDSSFSKGYGNKLRNNLVIVPEHEDKPQGESASHATVIVLMLPDRLLWKARCQLHGDRLSAVAISNLKGAAGGLDEVSASAVFSASALDAVLLSPLQ
jgi:hypothetical protein